MSAAAWLDGELPRRVRGVLASLPGQAEPEAPRFERLPEWLVIPKALHDAWSGDGPPLSELLWGQYALFLSIRIQDDLLDRQRDDLRLVFVADRFLLESLSVFDDPAVRPFFRARLRETVDAILRVKQLQARPGQFTADHLTLHASVSAIFKIAVAAVCFHRARTEEMRWIAALFDYLAIVSQICDDVWDVADDLREGRYTWVGNLLADRPWDPEPQAIVVRELRRLEELARQAVPPLAPSGVHDIARALGPRVDALERHWHEASVRHVFAEVL